MLNREWLVTNGLGGYASGTIEGQLTRRYHGLLVAALSAPKGRTVMWNHVSEHLCFPDGKIVLLGSEEPTAGQPDHRGVCHLCEFRLESGLPVWTYRLEELVLEKRIVMPHLMNTVHLIYRVISGSSLPRLELRPAFRLRNHHSPVDGGYDPPYRLTAKDDRYEISAPESDLPPLRLRPHACSACFRTSERTFRHVAYPEEKSRGYKDEGTLWSPGVFQLQLAKDEDSSLTGSVDGWATIDLFTPAEAQNAETARRHQVLEAAPAATNDAFGKQLILAADQFIISTVGRHAEATRAGAFGDEVRSINAGYYWFSDWRRDTMVSLEGLMLVTGRTQEAGYILRTFARYLQDGLIPDTFRESEKADPYQTADATLWYFHALHRYLVYTDDRVTLRLLLPSLLEIVEHHLRGKCPRIHVDPADGLLRQGSTEHPLTWMDAQTGDWIVTPRRGKAVEINALWFNALSVLSVWLQEEGQSQAANKYAEAAARVRSTFNKRFWFSEGGYLYDVIDGEAGDDATCRPNQVFSISLDHPVLERAHWSSVLEVVRHELLTPVGLRTLSPRDPHYNPTYDGDRASRDAAYHQGTVWPWLIGPFIDAWLKLHPDRTGEAQTWLRNFPATLGRAGVGTIGEIFDAQLPHRPRGCIAQAWSVAEVLRAWINLQRRKG